MAGKASFDKVDLILIDPDLGARQSARIILHNAGFREMRQGETLELVTHILTTFMPDLLLCADSLPDGELADFVRRVRKHEVGNNPFLPVIAMLDTPTPELVQDLMDAGVDDVVTKPLSTAALLERINSLIHNRKPFIVTDEYVGPARKGDNTASAVKVPNTLRAKATGEKLGYFDLEHGIKSAKQAIDEKRLQYIGVELSSLVGRVVPMLEKGFVNDVAAGGLAMLADESEAACAKLDGTRFDHVSELCRALADVARALHGDRGQVPDPREVKLLKPLSQAVQAAFAGGINSKEAAHQIVQQITKR